MRETLVLATRGSELALRQTEQVRQRLAALGASSELCIVRTSGDSDRPFGERREGAHPLGLVEPGVTGAFTHELERSLVEGRAGAAVHSLKDLPTRLLTGLVVAAVLPRADTRDVLLIRPEAHDPTRPLGLVPRARVGSGSLRRKLQLLRERPDLEVLPIRGNVPTRVAKVRDGAFDATVLAAAGLERLALETAPLVRLVLESENFLPAPGQAAIAVECRRDDAALVELLRKLDDPAAATCVAAERALLARLGGGCSLPLGALARIEAGVIRLEAALEVGGDTGVVRTERRDPDPFRVAQQTHRDLVAALGPARRLEGRVVGLCRPEPSSDRLAIALREAGAT
ncbi:MAG: hydroxymethylbilane synthase, partial [Planctomycetota bacterium]